MTPAILAAVLALLMASHERPPIIVETAAAYPAGYVTYVSAWRTCDAATRTATLYFRPDAGDWERAWEHAGARDCEDDGLYNGSTAPNCKPADVLRGNMAPLAERWYATSECAAWLGIYQAKAEVLAR